MTELEKKIYSQIGNNLLNLRVAHGLSRTALASKIGGTHQQLSKYETGHDRIPIMKLLLSADFFSVDITYFLEGVEIKTGDIKINKSERIYLEIMRNLNKIKDKSCKEAISTLTKSIANMGMKELVEKE